MLQFPAKVKYLLHIFISAALLALFGGGAVAQRNPPGTQCPGSRVIASTEKAVDGDTISFQVDLTGGNVDRSILKYTWYIDRGRILTGQGTPVINVDTTGQSPGSITATIDISPYPDCEWISSDSTRILPKGPLTKADQHF